MRKNTFEIVNKVLVVADLMELVELTGNVEEYMAETKAIVNYLNYNTNTNVDKLAEFIHKLFVEYFDECFDMETCTMVADCILKNLGE